MLHSAVARFFRSSKTGRFWYFPELWKSIPPRMIVSESASRELEGVHLGSSGAPKTSENTPLLASWVNSLTLTRKLSSKVLKIPLRFIADSSSPAKS
jgi:hypothetical protein